MTGKLRLEDLLVDIINGPRGELPFATRPATVADWVEVGRQLGAFDERWCDEHDASVIPNWHVESCGADDASTCRTVAVLVFRLPVESPTPKEREQ